MTNYTQIAKCFEKETTLAIAEAIEKAMKGKCTVEQTMSVTIWTCTKKGCKAEGRTFPVETFSLTLAPEVDSFGTSDVLEISCQIKTDVSTNILTHDWRVWKKTDGVLEVFLEVNHPVVLPINWSSYDIYEKI